MYYTMKRIECDIIVANHTVDTWAIKQYLLYFELTTTEKRNVLV